jgi:hypothetical protein
VAALATVSGCAAPLQTQIIGQTTAIAAAPGTAAPAIAAEIPVPESHSAQVLRYVVATPRAVQLHYQVTCPSAEREGTIGQTFDSYRTRRLAELERERQAQARLIGSIVGAVAPPVSGGAAVAGPGGSASVNAEVNAGTAATDVARANLPPPSLPPGDTGAAIVRGTVELGASAAGRCAFTLVTDPVAQDATGTQLFLELVRLVDVEAEERARLAAVRTEQDKNARGLRIWMLASLQRLGADPLARARARAIAQAQAEAENRRRQAAADEESRRRQAVAEEENRRRQEAQGRADHERWQREQAQRAKAAEAQAKIDREAAARRTEEGRVRQAAIALRWQIWARLQRLGADPLARERARVAAEARAAEESLRRQAAIDEENRRKQAVELRAEQERAKAERERLAREEADRQTRLAKEAAERQARAARDEADRRARAAKEEADRKIWLVAEEARLKAEFEARTKVDREAAERRARESEAREKVEREAAERRAREWRARQASFSLRWQLLARLQRQGADPQNRQRLEEARIAAREAEQRRQYEARAKRELDVVVGRRTAFDLRFKMVGRLTAMGADPDFRRKRDEAMFREMDAEARRLETARAEAAERVRWETQAAIDLRVLAKLRLRQLGAVDRPTCPPPPVETPPPAPFVGATWIAGRYAWNGIAWVWSSGHYEHPPEAGAVWVPPAQIAVSGTLVVRPGRWVRISLGAAPR